MNKRTALYGVSQGALSELKNTKIPLRIFSKICKSRFFEQGLVEAVKDKRVRYHVYLSTGQETISAALSEAIPEFMVFAQHRCHDTFLCWGGKEEKIRDELLGLPTGSSQGKAGSNCLQCHDNGIAMFGHHGLIGENVPLGVGAALGSKKPTVCFFGDGAAEEDYVFSAMGFAVTHKLPVLFVCQDNDLSILAKKRDRRSWDLSDVAQSMGLPTLEISDDPWTLYEHAVKLKVQLPAFLNIYTCRAFWHVGIGNDGPPEWDRFSIVKQELQDAGFSQEIEQIENEQKKEMARIWENRL